MRKEEELSSKLGACRPTVLGWTDASACAEPYDTAFLLIVDSPVPSDAAPATEAAGGPKVQASAELSKFILRESALGAEAKGWVFTTNR